MNNVKILQRRKKKSEENYFVIQWKPPQLIEIERQSIHWQPKTENLDCGMRKKAVRLMKFIFSLIDCTADERKKNVAFKPIAIKSSEIIQIFINLLDSYASLIAFHQNNSFFFLPSCWRARADVFSQSEYTQFRCNIKSYGK